MTTTALTVFVDSKEKRSLPHEAQKALSAAGGSYPQVVFMSPDLNKTYGSFNHASLKSQDYRKIFKDAKKKIKEAEEAGELSSAALSPSSTKTATGETAKATTTPNGAVMIQDPEMIAWQSAKGTEINARLTKFENNTYHLKNARGKTFKVVATDLSEDSQKIAEDLVEANK